MKRNLIILSLLFTSYNIFAQNVETIIEAPAITINGGININQIGYGIFGAKEKRQPYTYILNGNLNTTFFGVVNIPMNFSYSNKEIDYQYSLPFNRFTLSPSYKWVKTYIGYSTMSFSPYTMNGHEFLGFGCELTPFKNLKFSFLFGRFKDIIKQDTLKQNIPSYKRFGGGVKLDYTGKNYSVGIILFKASDEKKSLPNYIPNDSISILPKDNLTGAVNCKVNLITNLSLNLEYSFSALNDNTSSKDLEESSFPDFLFKPKSSVSYFEQYKFGFIYKASKYGSLGVNYERVDPGYKTLGAYYFTDDFQNITINISTAILKWITIAANIGIQEDNLNKQKSSGMDRIVFSLNTNIKATKKLNLNVSYSNFQTHTYIRPLLKNAQSQTKYDNNDTLNFTQINQTINFGANYVLPSSKKKKQNLNLNCMIQQSGNKRGNQTVGDSPIFYGLTGAYSLSHIPSNLSFSSALNFNENNSKDINMKIIGASLNIRKSFLKKKLKTSISTSYNKTYNNGESSGYIMNTRLNNAYTLFKKHNFNFAISMVNNKAFKNNYSEFTVTLGYSYNFSTSIDYNDGFKYKGKF